MDNKTISEETFRRHLRADKPDDMVRVTIDMNRIDWKKWKKKDSTIKVLVEGQY